MYGKVLVLGQENPSLLAVIRALGRRKLNVHVAWCPRGCPWLHSKYISKVHDIPTYSPDDETWKQILIDIMQREKFDLVIPTNDRTIIPLHINRADFKEFGQIYLIDEKAYEITNDKFKTTELARSLNIPTPQETLVYDYSIDADFIGKEFGFPVIVKPRSSYNKRDLSSKQYVLKIYDQKQLDTILKSVSQKSPLVVQKNFIGIGAGVNVLADKGEILYAFQHIRIHEYPFGGASSYRKSTTLDPSLLDASKKLIKALKYTGVAMIEFRVDSQTGEWVFIELNARFWGSLPLAVASGADFPYYLYQLLVDKKRDFDQNYKTGIYCRNLIGDFNWLRQNIKADHSDPTLTTLPLYEIIKESINLVTFREYNDTCIFADPIPGLFEIIDYIKIVLSNLFSKFANVLKKRLSNIRDYL